MGKQSIRSKYLAYRDGLTKSERSIKSSSIWEKLKKEECFKNAEVVLAYMDYRSEVMTTGLVEELLNKESGKRVFVPLVEGMDIAFYEIHSFDELKSGYQGIREPESKEETLFTTQIASDNKCLLLVPGSVFDRQLARMGYGKGFYDRFIHKFPMLTRAGLAFECQIAGQVPAEEHDKRMDLIVTEKEIIK